MEEIENDEIFEKVHNYIIAKENDDTKLAYLMNIKLESYIFVPYIIVMKKPIIDYVDVPDKIINRYGTKKFNTNLYGRISINNLS